MPRPGPRPYECVRRAWHSERHQPMRGSIIQQIFRVATEAHSPAIKNNKEWQEKLPVVVLKAEEIIYSKANCEAEYLNPDTLWDRLNDAINTIIRRDDTTETGELLPPCVEAALNLGCKPVRTSRSDRHNNPRAYLASRNQHPYSASPKTFMTNPLNFIQVLNHQNNYPLSDTFAAVHHQHPLADETNPPLNLGSVYPLYYGFEAKEPPPQVRTSNQGSTIFVGRPVIRPALSSSRMDLLEKSSGGRLFHVPNRIVKETAVSDVEGAWRDRECDLSLRLGTCMQSNKTSSAYGLEDVGLRVSREGSKFNLSSHLQNVGCQVMVPFSACLGTTFLGNN